MDAHRKLKILSIYRGVVNDARGTPIKVLSLSREFAKRTDVEFTLCAWDVNESLEFSRYFQLTNKHLDDLYKIYRYIRHHKIEVVIGHTMATYYYLWPLKYLTNAKIVLEMQGYIEEEAKFYGSISPLLFRFSKIIYGLFYSQCDLITTSSQTSADIISQYNKNVVAVWGGVDTNFFNPSVTPGNFVHKKTGDILIGYTGNARIWQGVSFLLETYTELCLQYPEFKLALLCSEVVHTKVPGITYVGKIEHEKVASFSALCDILVIPRLHNEVNRISFPSKLIEYMALGKAVVVSATSDAHKVVSNNIDGLVFAPGDKEAFKGALISLRNKRLRNRLGDEAWNTVQKSYTWKHQADIFVAHCKQLFK